MDSFSLSDIIPATPAQIFRAWLTGAEHAAFTGSPATAEPMPGAAFTAWDGYIEGTTLEIEPGRRILQSWRTTEFPTGAESSLLEVLLVSIPEGTRVTLNHNRIPDGQGKSYLDGWKSHYFAPLKRHFGRESRGEGPTPMPKTTGVGRPAKKKAKAASKTKPRKALKAKRAKSVVTKRKPTRKPAPVKPTKRRSR